MKTNRLLLSMVMITSLYSCLDKNSVVNEVSIEGQLVNMGENGGKDVMWIFEDNIYSRDNKWNVYSGELTKTQWKKSENVFVSGHGHNEFGILSLSQDSDRALYVLDRPLKGDKLVSLTKIPNADNIAAVKDQTKWEKYDLTRLPPFFCMGDNFEVISDSTILVLGAPGEDLKHVFSIANFKAL